MLSSQRLLIIEEVSLIALDIQRAVEGANAGAAVFARDFREAAGLVDRFGDFDLAIVNPPTPGTPEMQIAAQLAAACPAIVICTAASVELAETALAGAEIVAKPFSDEMLLAACRRALERRRA